MTSPIDIVLKIMLKTIWCCDHVLQEYEMNLKWSFWIEKQGITLKIDVCAPVAKPGPSSFYQNETYRRKLLLYAELNSLWKEGHLQNY